MPFSLPDSRILPKLVLVFGDSGSGKSELQNAFESHFFVPVHPIQDLKNYIEEMCEIPRGSLHTKEGKDFKPKFQDLIISGGYPTLLFSVKHFLCLHYFGSYTPLTDPDLVVGKNQIPISEAAFRFINDILLPNGSDHSTLRDLELASWLVFGSYLDPEFSLPYFARVVNFNLFERKSDLVISAIRNKHEFDFLRSLIQKQLCIPYCISIQRPFSNPLSSDSAQPSFLYWCQQHPEFFPSDQIFCLSNSQSLSDWHKVCKNLAFNIKHRIGCVPSLNP